MIDLSTLTDEQLNEQRVAILAERERRDNLAQIPDQVEELSRTYRDGGGDPSVLEKAVAGEVEDDRANS